ncbi:MAG: hypothetical protein COW11_04615 [Candidatus Omnitrophica bacterium CG12_big_fil_rev_8_21_14_0_65_43_15]|uniref:YbgF trimerisation domain-containing protein n=1 Tax=Candidatus Taenaricola geysiri TaxID=1974752 RepID=A0A2J0LE75_9BACT|nr:MAG: hypothetical protein AUJ89_04560 [Candidatus Omnitrophica bacterium CG1_02_43_210]PIV12492.1 MAG: hypothetical protein COS48_00195 [Candidatus Omnitrophica bacterium CG03_land_8_20_14_0_80_43_22]PIW66151.1 MAG: hypothetical protein COW11_04615 [Candidatus Omnitrophica bacterium CG12_big_fil_rev_8_21_14_0_65_43_15]PIW80504.1 MAG: hypothetical protein COZ98_01965 [Candidatus Omnitrophica bacterium CG_4_8_14_3_um_filter_43_15]PIY84299.1 MAG: hypothetical protein COY77_03435 [Candidatus Omn
MKNIFIKIFIISVVFAVLSAANAGAGNDENFREAEDLDNYPGITNLQSAQLNINLASAIHQENLQIIQFLQKIEERLDKLEASIQRIEQQVVRR